MDKPEQVPSEGAVEPGAPAVTSVGVAGTGRSAEVAGTGSTRSTDAPTAGGSAAASGTEAPYLQVSDLRVSFGTADGVVRAVDGVSFSVARGRTLGVVGESGSGKSVMSLAVLGLHDVRRARVSGRVLVGGRDVVGLGEEELRGLRGRDVAMVFQDPLSALHPFYSVGRQVVEAFRVHHPGVGFRVARARAVEVLGRVGIPQPGRRFDDFPHEFSGGMRQRVMIAMALVNDPSLLIADEPTTALDVTVQAQILDLLGGLQEEFGSAIVLVTHDLGVVSQVADEVLVMYAGRVVEFGGVGEVLRRPGHPYTWGLLSSVPSLSGVVGGELVPIRGNPPSLIDVPGGCAFHPRCRFAGLTGGRSRSVVPELVSVGGGSGHVVACHLSVGQRVELFRDQVAGAGAGVGVAR